MKAELGNFKNKLFGGFDRHDVVRYIEEIAGERNRYRKSAERMSEEMEALTRRAEEAEADAAAAREEAEAANRRAEEIRITAVQDAAGILAELETEYRGLCADVETATAETADELNRLSQQIVEIHTRFTAVQERLAALQASLVRELPAEEAAAEEVSE